MLIKLICNIYNIVIQEYKHIQFLLITCLLSICSIYSQKSLNIDSISRIITSEKCSSIWGMTHSSGKEIGLLATRTGLRIYDLTEPSQPLEIKYIPGNECLWRELKTYKDFIYVVTECSDGVLIVDASNLDSIKYQYVFEFENSSGQQFKIQSAHTLFVDDSSYLYLAGSSALDAGFIILDLKKNPLHPEFVFGYDDEYYHEVFVQRDTLYAASIYLGTFVIWDIHNRHNPVRLISQNTGFRFTHSVWKEDSRAILYTSDESSAAYIEAWDISDLSRIKLLDNFRPNFPKDKTSIPHNCFYKDNYLFVSWYTEGLRIVDVSKADNLVEIANYDTYPGTETGFHGCWNVYPFFKSGIIIASDIENGMYVLKFNGKRASYLEGIIRDKKDGTFISNAKVNIIGNNTSSQANSDIQGRYKTGYSNTEKVLIKIEKPGFISILDRLDLLTNKIIVKDYEMEAVSKYTIKVHTTNSKNNEAEPDAIVRIWNTDFSYTGQTNIDGNLEMKDINSGNYLFQIAKWGKLHYSIPLYSNIADSSLLVKVDEGYEDQFNINQNWLILPDTQRLKWQRSNFKELFPVPSNYPSRDVDFDIGDNAMYTKNFDDYDFSINVVGHSYLISPEMDLSQYDEINLNYTAWAYGGWDSSIKETYLLFNDDLIFLENIPENLRGVFNPSSSFQLLLNNKERTKCHFVLHLWNDPDSINYAISMKAALDGFKLTGHKIVRVVDNLKDKLNCFPNPFTDEFSLYNPSEENYNFEIYDVLGKSLLKGLVSSHSEQLLNLNVIQSNVFLLKYSTVSGNRTAVLKLIKN
ncbi:MAG: choice-of-anchor B family protein [Saprospiraceae bacterium]